jgi:hypothetical protein
MIRACFFFLIAFTAPAILAQTCTTYVLVDPFDGKTGTGMDNLKAENFGATVGSLSLPIVSVTQSFNNRVLVLIEIRGAGVQQARALVQASASHAPAGRPIAFGVFAEEAFISREFSDDPKKRSAAIDEILTEAAHLPAKDTALYDSLHQAIAAFGMHQPGDTIVLMTDGQDYKSKRSPADLTKELAANGIRLLVVIEPKTRPVGRDFAQHARESDRALKTMASSTGGAFNHSGYGRTLEFAWAGYMLGIQTPVTLDKPKDWKLQIKNANGEIDKNALLYFPWKLAPCGATTTATR